MYEVIEKPLKLIIFSSIVCLEPKKSACYGQFAGRECSANIKIKYFYQENEIHFSQLDFLLGEYVRTVSPREGGLILNWLRRRLLKQ